MKNFMLMLFIGLAGFVAHAQDLNSTPSGDEGVMMQVSDEDLLVLPDMARFDVQPDETLKDLLERWAELDGRQFYALPGNFSGALEYRFEVGAPVAAELQEALETILRLVNMNDKFKRGDVELSSCLYQKPPRTLLIKVNKNECP